MFCESCKTASQTDKTVAQNNVFVQCRSSFHVKLVKWDSQVLGKSREGNYHYSLFNSALLSGQPKLELASRPSEFLTQLTTQKNGYGSKNDISTCTIYNNFTYSALSTFRHRNLKMKQSPVILDLCLKKTWSVQGNHIIIMTPLFSKSSIFKMFSLHTKRWHFQSPQVWVAFP